MITGVINEGSQLRLGNGIFLSALKDAKELAIGKGGILGTFGPEDSLLLDVEIIGRKNLMPKVIHRSRSLSGKTDEFTLLEPSNRHFQWAVSLRGNGPWGFTTWPKNQIHIVELLGKGKFRIIQCSVASQNFNCFLRVQELYHGKVDIADGKATITDPKFAPWNGMIEYIRLATVHQKLSVGADYNYADWEEFVDIFYPTANPVPPPSQQIKELGLVLKEGEAVVTMWHDASSTGWTVANYDGVPTQCKLHYSNVYGLDEDEFVHFEEGDIVTFADTVIDKDFHGKAGGLERRELVGVWRA